MNEDACPYPPEVRDLLLSRIWKRKNRYSAMKLAEWMWRQGLQWRVTKGFELVRGSDREDRFGLKERADIKALGLTGDMIRGAIKTLREVGYIIETGRSFYGVKENFRGLKRRAACRFRMDPEIMSLMVKAQHAMNAALREAKQILNSAKTKVERCVAAAQSVLGCPSSSSPPNRLLRTITPCSGDLALDHPQKAPRVAQEPPLRPQPVSEPPIPTAQPMSATGEMTDFDRRMEALRLGVAAAAQSRQQPPEPIRPRLEPTRDAYAPKSKLERLLEGVLKNVVRPPEPEGSS